MLGSGSPEQIPDEDAGGDDLEFENHEARTVTLYKVSDSSGKMKIDKMGTKPLVQDLLDTNVSNVRKLTVLFYTAHDRLFLLIPL